VAFDYRRGRSEFLEKKEFRVLEYLYDKMSIYRRYAEKLNLNVKDVKDS